MWASNPPNPLSPLALPQTLSCDILHIKLYFLSSPFLSVFSTRFLLFWSDRMSEYFLLASLQPFSALCRTAISLLPCHLKQWRPFWWLFFPFAAISFFTEFYVLLTVQSCIICFKWSQLGAHYFLVNLFQLLYTIRATMCPSSGELTVSTRHWYFSLCMDGCLVCTTSGYICFNFSTCFGQLCAYHQQNLLYLRDTGIFHCVWMAVWSALLLSKFISTSLHVSGNYVPIISRTYCI